MLFEAVDDEIICLWYVVSVADDGYGRKDRKVARAWVLPWAAR